MEQSRHPHSVRRRSLLLLLNSVSLLLLPEIQVASAADSVNQSATSKRQDLIPYPRVGRSSGTIQDVLLRFQDQAILVGSPHMGKDSTHAKPPEKHNEIPALGPASEYMLPYLRPGRSDNTKEDGKDNSDQTQESGETMIPNVRFGRSKFRISDPFGSSNLRFGKRQDVGEYIIPGPRMGKRASLEGRITAYPIYFSNGSSLNLDPLLWNLIAEDSEYITPYPRIGRSYDEGILRFYGAELKRDTDTQIPTMRLGRDSDTMVPTIRLGRRDNLIIPYPRMGRSSGIEDLLTPYPRIGKRQKEDSSKVMNKEYLEFLKFLEASGSMTPYPRMVKRMFNRHQVSKRSVGDPIYAYIRNDHNKEQNENPKGQFKQIPSHILYSSDQSYMLPYMRPGRSQQNEEEDENLTMIPYMRMG